MLGGQGFSKIHVYADILLDDILVTTLHPL